MTWIPFSYNKDVMSTQKSDKNTLKSSLGVYRSNFDNSSRGYWMIISSFYILKRKRSHRGTGLLDMRRFLGETKLDMKRWNGVKGSVCVYCHTVTSSFVTTSNRDQYNVCRLVVGSTNWNSRGSIDLTQDGFWIFSLLVVSLMSFD